MPLTPIATRSSLTSANNPLTEGPFIVSVAIRLASMGRQVSSAMKNKYLENTSGTLLPSFQRKALDFIRARLPEKSLETATSDVDVRASSHPVCPNFKDSGYLLDGVIVVSSFCQGKLPGPDFTPS